MKESYIDVLKLVHHEYKLQILELQLLATKKMYKTEGAEALQYRDLSAACETIVNMLEAYMNKRIKEIEGMSEEIIKND